MAQGKKGAIEQDMFIKFRINSKFYKDSQELAKQRGTNFSKMVRDYLQAELEAAAQQNKDVTVRNLLTEAALAYQGKDPIENNIKNFFKRIVK